MKNTTPVRLMFPTTPLKNLLRENLAYKTWKEKVSKKNAAIELTQEEDVKER